MYVVKVLDSSSVFRDAIYRFKVNIMKKTKALKIGKRISIMWDNKVG